MAGDEEWKKPKYRNWVRGAKGLEYLQDGLQKVVGDTVLRQRDQILQNLATGSPVQCNQCTRTNLLPEHIVSNKLCNKNTCLQQNNGKCYGNKTKGRRKCPNGICSKFYDEIVHAHRFKEPMWNNTDPSTWCSDPVGWSFAKCFQTTPNPGTSASETDAAGLLSVILSDNFFQNVVAVNLASKPNIFSLARKHRNEILHSPKMELEDSKLQDYLDDFIAVLQDQKCLLNDQVANQCVQKLIQLKNNQIKINFSDQIKLAQIRKDALSALEQLKEKEKEAVSRMDDKKQEALAEIEDTKSAALKIINESDIQNRLRQTESTIEHLIVTVQNLKKGSSDTPVESDIYSRVASSRKTISSSDAEDVEIEDSDKETKKVIDKATNMLIDYMKPDPILDCAIEYDLLGYRQLRDIKEEQKTTQKNRCILEIVRRKSKAGYANLKACLKNTDQSKLVELLECMERGEDHSILLKQIHEQMILDINQASKARYTTEVQAPVVAADQAYIQLKARLQDDLIEFYRSQHSTILLSPLIEEDDTPLLEFYVMPDIYAVKRDRQGTKEEKALVSTLRNVFYKDDTLCKEIYLTADAGLGKTSLSKRLTLAWCHAKSPDSNEKACFSEEFREINAMGEFAFVFLLLLRDSHKECEIDKLIWNQIVSRLENNYTLNDLQTIMSKERSLVILDGLDEWTHPSNNCDHGQSFIPHRRIRKNCTILTTTRPWKLSVSDIKSSQIDQKFEIAGLSPHAAHTLKKSVISHIKNVEYVYELRVHVCNFTKAVREKHLSALEINPLLLMYLICLWCDNIELGQSQSELYSKIVELLLSRTVKKYKKDEDSLPEVESTQCNIPPCFSKQTHCRKFYTLLTTLGQLAFQTLFKETKEENTLVFDSSVAEQYLNKDCLTFCLSTGIITQSKVQIKLAEIQEPKVSFAHKTVQEFFAALYMHSSPDHTSAPEIVASKCKCVKDVLDMSTILKFIIGMNVHVASSISRELMKIINEDEITREYRSTLKEWYGYVSHPLKDFQDMCISCCKELPRENGVSLCLQDVFIERSCQQEQYREHLKQLTMGNKQNIKSLYISTPYRSEEEVIEDFGLQDKVPDVISSFGKKNVELYRRALAEGKEKVFHIRLMIVGPYGVGKTTLAKRLLGESVNIEAREPTDGISILNATYNLKTSDWKLSNEGDKLEQDTLNRKRRIFESQKEEHARRDKKDTASIGEAQADFKDMVPEVNQNKKEVRVAEVTTGQEESADTDIVEEMDVKEHHVTEESKESNELLVAEVTTGQEESVDTDIVEEMDVKEHHVTEESKASNELLVTTGGEEGLERDTVEEMDVYEDDVPEQGRELNELLEMQHLKMDNDSIKLSIYDFAGQEAFYGTHQVFFSKRAVYLLVNKLSSKEDERQRTTELTKYWMNLIHEFGSQDGMPGHPKVILIGTFKNQFRGNTKKFFSSLKSEILGPQGAKCHIEEHLSSKYFDVDNENENDPNIKNLQNLIYKTVSDGEVYNAFWGETVPAKWISLEEKLLREKKNGVKILRKEEVENLNSKQLSIDELDLFLKFHHELGTWIFFGTKEELNGYILLDPQWLIDAFKCLITAESFERPETVKKFHETGKLYLTLLDEIWNDDEHLEEQFYKHRDEILKFMQVFGILSDNQHDHDGDYIFAPGVLTEPYKGDPTDRLDKDVQIATSILCFTNQSKFIPNTVFHRLLALTISNRDEWSEKKNNYVSYISCNYAEFHMINEHMLHMFLDGHVIQVWISKQSSDGKEPEKGICMDVRDFVDTNLKMIRQIKCENCKGTDHTYMYKLEDITEDTACKCGNCKGKDKFLRPKATKYWLAELELNDTFRFDGRIFCLNQDQLNHLKKVECIENFTSGGTATLYKSQQDFKGNRLFEIPVVLKEVCATKYIDQLCIIRERFASRISHYGIVPLYGTADTGCDPKKHYFISPFMVGGDLRQVLDKKTLHPSEAIRIVIQIASAIEYLHTPVDNVRDSVVHKDISAQNVVLDDCKNARLLDFGLAREICQKTSGHTKDMGKQDYLPKSGNEATVRTDLHCFGVLIREILTEVYPRELWTENHEELLERSDILKMLQEKWRHDGKVSHIGNLLLDLSDACVAGREDLFNKSLDNLKQCSRTNNISRWKRPDEKGNSKRKCDICLKNECAPKASMSEHNANCQSKIRVCLSCMKNSFLNPVTCHSCDAKIVPPIGHGWGALLFAGKDNERKDARSFSNDVDKMEKTITSMAPLIMGIRNKYVHIVKPKEGDSKGSLKCRLEAELEQLQGDDDVSVLFVYYSGHGKQSEKDFTFVLEPESEEDLTCITSNILSEKLQKCTQIKKIILILDCCYPPVIHIDGKAIIQINACRPSESVNTTECDSSLFTTYVLQCLMGKSEKNNPHIQKCKICMSSKSWPNDDYINAATLHDYVSNHIEDSQMKPTIHVNGITSEEMKIAFYTDEPLEIRLSEKPPTERVGRARTITVPLDFLKEMKELRKEILEQEHETGDTLVKIFCESGNCPDDLYEECDTIEKVMSAWTTRRDLYFEIAR